MSENMKQGVWYSIFIAIFIILTCIAFVLTTRGLTRFEWLFLLDGFDMAVLSLATLRVIRLVSFDKIFAFVRNSLLDMQPNGDYAKPEWGVRRTLAELVECLWCSGIWAALFVMTLYFLADIGRFFVILLAIAAVGSALQLLIKKAASFGEK